MESDERELPVQAEGSLRPVVAFVVGYSAVDVILWWLAGQLASPWDSIARAVAFLLAVAIVLYVVAVVVWVRWFIPRLIDFIRVVTSSRDI